MIEYTNLLLIHSIGYMLRKEFGDTYKYYDTLVPQDMERPGFFVRRISNINTKRLSSAGMFREDNLNSIVVRFFPVEERNIPNLEAVWQMEEQLAKLFSYIVLSLDGETIDGKIVVQSLTSEEVDGTLQMTMDLRVGTIELTEEQKMRVMTLNQNIKED